MKFIDEIDEEKVSKYLFNNEEVIIMERKDFDKFIYKGKIKDKIKNLTNNILEAEVNNRYFETLAQIEVLKELLEE